MTSSIVVYNQKDNLFIYWQGIVAIICQSETWNTSLEIKFQYVIQNETKPKINDITDTTNQICDMEHVQ